MVTDEQMRARARELALSWSSPTERENWRYMRIQFERAMRQLEGQYGKTTDCDRFSRASHYS